MFSVLVAFHSKQVRRARFLHNNNVIMSAIASQITSVSIACSTVGSGADPKKHQNSATQAFVRGIHRSPVNSPKKASNAENVFIWSRHHWFNMICTKMNTTCPLQGHYRWEKFAKHLLELRSIDRTCLISGSYSIMELHLVYFIEGALSHISYGGGWCHKYLTYERTLMARIGQALSETIL